MATSYTHSIEKVMVIRSQDGLSNVIKLVTSKVKAVSDDGIIKIFTQQYELAAPDPLSFVDVSLVTEQNLLDWIQSSEFYMTEGFTNMVEESFTRYRTQDSYSDYKLSWMPDDDTRYERGYF